MTVTGAFPVIKGFGESEQHRLPPSRQCTTHAAGDLVSRNRNSASLIGRSASNGAAE